MKAIKKKRILIISSYFLFLWILGLLQNSNISYAQPIYEKSTDTIILNSNFLILENSDNSGTHVNKTSVEIDLESSRWNITSLDLNFTSVKFGREINTIVDDPEESKKVDKQKAQGVQINITETTIIFGVYVYISSSKESVDPVYVQLHGFTDDGTNKPNNTILAKTFLNVSTTEGWYYQNFSTPTKQGTQLSKGNYYLVINASELKTSDTIYRWYHDKDNPNDLYTSVWSSGNWQDGDLTDPFTYKLLQRLDRTYKPEEIKMGVNFKGTIYNVTEGIDPYTGNVTIPMNNYFPGSDNLVLSMTNNRSIDLLVNYSYHIQLHNLISSEGSINIKNGQLNFWSLTPDFLRTNGNYSIQFDHPSNWIWPGVFKNGINLTDINDQNTEIIGNTIFIYNDSFSQGAFWNITAYSPDIPFDATIPTKIYGASQTMKITVIPPPTIGNLSFFLIDPFGDGLLIGTSENPTEDVLFEHTFSINPFIGQWKAYILWNNLTDVGLQVLTFQVGTASTDGGGGGSGTTVVSGIDPQLIYMTLLYIVIGSLVGLSSYKMVKRHKRAKVAHREKIFNKYMDLLNLDYIMISEKESGVNVYEQILAGKERDVTLISGFLEAIRSFGIELSGSEDESQAIRLQYQNMNIIMNDFRNFRILNVMKEPPSQDFLDSLRPLSHDIETYYGKSLKEFDGEVTKFRGIKDLLEDHLQTPLLYPLKVVMAKETKLNSAEKSIVNKALSLMKRNNVDHFFVSYLMGKAKEFNVKNAEIILKIIEKKVFRPIE